ncbi:GAF domain-containing protein [Zhihengliuella sp.]|uniref:GAF domain-containing protein n=1 Tax=Zhihengliuella sp. TaxID=1954483 RepID=UPI002810D2DB|nr:GAF domain-containing protein [Zhihengliuella sp.]
MSVATPAQPALQRSALAAHDVLGSAAGGAFELLRPVVGESWRRSLGFLTPGRIEPSVALQSADLSAYRRDHPLAAVLPVITRLLVEPARDTGLLIAVGDAEGRLLCVEGDDDAVRRAEGMAFVPGADWSERSVGTSAPGTALATGQGVQVSGAEHFSEIAHRFSCTASPIHAPDGQLLGVVDLTGGSEAVAAHSMGMVRAAVAAAEAELRLQGLQLAASTGTVGRRPTHARRPASPATSRDARPSGRSVLRILGSDEAVLDCAAGTVRFGGRHGEILALLAWHGEAGLTADRLAVELFGDDARTVTLRAELVRLRQALRAALPADAAEGAAVGLVSRPYRFEPTPDCDARRVLELIGRGHYRRALETYAGQVLPRSAAPGVVAIRAELSGALREAMLSDAGPEALMQYLELPEAAEDVEALRTALRILPPRSPRRAVIVSRLERLDTADGA